VEEAAMTGPIALDTFVCDLEQSNATWEAIEEICEELGLDARNALAREIVAREVTKCARLVRDPASICEMVLKELKGPTLAA
jgi:hypothetical protein